MGIGLLHNTSLVGIYGERFQRHCFRSQPMTDSCNLEMVLYNENKGKNCHNQRSIKQNNILITKLNIEFENKVVRRLSIVQ